MRFSVEMRSLVVILSMMAAFVTGAFQSPWWVPLVVAPAAAWGLVPVACGAFRWHEMTPLRYLAVFIGELVELYVAFGLGWLIAWLFS